MNTYKGNTAILLLLVVVSSLASITTSKSTNIGAFQPVTVTSTSSSSSTTSSSTSTITATANTKGSILLVRSIDTQNSYHGHYKTALEMVATPPSKYPTQRGSTVDSRKIVSQGLAQSNLQAIRVKHILFATEDLAKASLNELRSAGLFFDDLAKQLSNCAETRDEGGEIGWVNIETDGNEHLDLILPKHAREKVFQTSTKPGDVILIESDRGFHLIQITDVMVDVRQMTNLRTRNTDTYLSGIAKNKKSKIKGILGGAIRASQEEQLLEGDNIISQFNHDLTYKMETMGCQMNVADSERMEGQLQALGLRPFTAEEENDKSKQPDMIILNTCSIRDHAEQKVYSYIGPYAKRKENGEDVTIVVAGCVAQQEGEALLRRVPAVDLVMGPQYANRLGDLLEDVSNGNQVVATEASHIMEDSTKPRRTSTVAAWVNVIYGCNERCTYCIVPTTRGVEQSRPIESIVKEVEELVSQGYKEVTLLGQNIDAYGRDMIPKRKFSDLLRIVGSIPGLKRLRFVTSHPRYMSLGVIDAVAETPTACLNFHIPPQSGSNEVLEAMGRGHTREKYLQIVDRIRQRVPDAAISADIIVGFPGETEEQFLETLSLMEEVKFDTVNTAAYSPRPNTPAANWENQIDDDVKQDRLQRINRLNLQHAAERRARMMGRNVEVLVEERNVKVPTQVMGRTTHGYIVYFDGLIEELKGKLVSVEITECHTYSLTGKMKNIIDDE